MKALIEGSHGLLIKKYSFENIIIFSGRTGSGKTYQINKYIELDFTKKLLLASVGDCKYEFVKVKNLTKISYYDTFFSVPPVDKFKSLFTILETQIKNSYDVIIMDNVSFDTYQQINKLFYLCLSYPNTKFFITIDEKISLNEENEDFSRFFLKNDQ